MMLARTFGRLCFRKKGFAMSMSTSKPDSFYVEESIEMYQRGGFHPVRYGDTLKEGRYKVVRKLGWGMWATVWLARDMSQSRHIAIKINRADITDERSPNELQLMLATTQIDQDHPGRCHVVQLLDHFRQDGPNGTHICLVMEVLGPSLEEVLKSTGGIPSQAQKRLIRQILTGLDFLHGSCRIVHTDLKIDNFFIDIPDVEAVIAENVVNAAPLLHWDKYFPVVPSQPLPLGERSLNPESMVVKIGDVGTGCFDNSISEHFAVTRGHFIHPPKIRAPEVMLGSPWDVSSDMWCLGCTIFEITNDGRQFMIIEDPEKSYLAAAGFMQAVLGPFPPYIIEQARHKNVFFKSDGSFKFHVDPAAWFDDLRGDKIATGETVQDADNYISFLRSMLEMDPKARASARALLDHQWLSSQ